MNENEKTIEVVAALKSIQLPPGATAEVVGAWVWIEFASKPELELRQKLSSIGFRWIAKRGKWAHPCGKFSRHGKGDPRDKYEVQEL